MFISVGDSFGENRVNLPPVFTPGFVYHCVWRAIGETDTNSSDGSAELWINGNLMYNVTNISIDTASTGATLQGGGQIVVSGVNSRPFNFRDVIMFDDWSSAPGVAPNYYRVDSLEPSVFGGDNNFAEPANGIAGLTDTSDTTIASGATDGDQLQVRFTQRTNATVGTTEHQMVYIRGTKSTTENTKVDVTLLDTSNSAVQSTNSFIDLTTNSFTDRYIPLELTAPLDNVELELVINDVAP